MTAGPDGRGDFSPLPVQPRQRPAATSGRSRRPPWPCTRCAARRCSAACPSAAPWSRSSTSATASSSDTNARCRCRSDAGTPRCWSRWSRTALSYPQSRSPQVGWTGGMGNRDTCDSPRPTCERARRRLPVKGLGFSTGVRTRSAGGRLRTDKGHRGPCEYPPHRGPSPARLPFPPRPQVVEGGTPIPPSTGPADRVLRLLKRLGHSVTAEAFVPHLLSGAVAPLGDRVPAPAGSGRRVRVLLLGQAQLDVAFHEGVHHRPLSFGKIIGCDYLDRLAPRGQVKRVGLPPLPRDVLLASLPLPSRTSRNRGRPRAQASCVPERASASSAASSGASRRSPHRPWPTGRTGSPSSSCFPGRHRGGWRW